MNGIQGLRQTAGLKTERNKASGGNGSFGQILTEKLNQEKLRVSRHASERMEERGVVLSDELKEGLSAAVETAEKKGARNALVIGEASVFIVNVPGRVVVTAVTKEEMKDNIFTNIDSAIWM